VSSIAPWTYTNFSSKYAGESVEGALITPGIVWLNAFSARKMMVTPEIKPIYKTKIGRINFQVR